METKKDKTPKAPKPPKHPKRPKQPDLPDLKGQGVAPERHADIEKVSEEYVEARDERMQLTNRESTLKAALSQVMHEHGLTIYRYDGYEVTITPPEGEKIHVRKIKEESDAEVTAGEGGDGL